jgi:hypothetical protein
MSDVDWDPTVLDHTLEDDDDDDDEWFDAVSDLQNDPTANSSTSLATTGNIPLSWKRMTHSLIL